MKVYEAQISDFNACLCIITESNYEKQALKNSFLMVMHLIVKAAKFGQKTVKNALFKSCPLNWLGIIPINWV